MQQFSWDFLRNRNRLISFLVIPIAMLLLLQITYMLSGGGFTNLTFYLVLLVSSLPLSLLVIIRWEASFYFWLVVLVLEGVIRNLTAQPAVLLFKDVVLGLIYVGYLRQYRFGTIFERKFKLFSLAVLAIFFYSLAEFINPRLINPLVGVIGVKTLLFYVPLIYVTYDILNTHLKIIRFIVLVLILTNISCLAGLFQYIGGLDVIRLFVPDPLVSAGNLGNYYKLTGTFGGAGNFSVFLNIGFVLALGLVFSKTERWLVIFSWVTIIDACVLFVLNTQRASWVFVILCFLLGTFAQTSNRKVRLIRSAVALLLLVLFTFAISNKNNIIGDRFSQFTEGSGLQSYLYYAPINSASLQLDRVLQGATFGYGIGMASPGTRYLVSNEEFVESYVAVLLYELGLPGLLLNIGLSLILIYIMVRALFITTDPRYHNLLYFIFILQVYSIILGLTYAPLSVPPTAQFFWILPALMLRFQTWQEQQTATIPEQARLRFLATEFQKG